LKIWRDHPAFRQRFTGRFRDDGNTFGGIFELNEDEAGWNEGPEDHLPPARRLTVRKVQEPRAGAWDDRPHG
jgi:hypothetical protein